MEPSPLNLSGRRIMVLEPDPAFATGLCADLRSLGATVLGPAPTVFYAHLLLMSRRGVDGAILGLPGSDGALNGSEYDEVYELADQLRRDGVPLMFASARAGTQTGAGLGPAFRSAPCLSKPVPRDELVSQIGRLLRTAPQITGVSARERAASAPVPANRAAGTIGPGEEERWSRAVARALALPAARR